MTKLRLSFLSLAFALLTPALALAQGSSLCSVTTAAPVYTTGTLGPSSCDTAGNLRVATPTGTSSQTIQGVAAHDAVISGNPVRTGARAITANPTAVATGDVADSIATLVGVQIVKTYSIPELDWSYPAAASGILNTTTAVTIRAAQAAGIRNYITGLDITAEALGAVTEFAVRDGAAGTVLWRTKIGTGGTPNGPLSVTFNTPLRGTAATLLEIVTLSASVTGAVYVNVQGYSAP